MYGALRIVFPLYTSVDLALHDPMPPKSAPNTCRAWLCVSKWNRFTGQRARKHLPMAVAFDRTRCSPARHMFFGQRAYLCGARTLWVRAFFSFLPSLHSIKKKILRRKKSSPPMTAKDRIRPASMRVIQPDRLSLFRQRCQSHFLFLLVPSRLFPDTRREASQSLSNRF